jgi:phage terminase Nu1 subunit (DNA packaging protein)
MATDSTPLPKANSNTSAGSTRLTASEIDSLRADLRQAIAEAPAAMDRARAEKAARVAAEKTGPGADNFVVTAAQHRLAAKLLRAMDTSEALELARHYEQIAEAIEARALKDAAGSGG